MVVLMVLDEGMVEMMVAKGVSLLALLEAAGIKKRRKKCKGEEETKGVWIYIYRRGKLYNNPMLHSKWRFKVAFHSKWRPRLAVGLSC